MPKTKPKPSGSGTSTASALKAPTVSFKAPVRQSARQAGTTISKKTYEALVTLGDSQPTANMKGGAGIPGSRKATDVVLLKSLEFPKLDTQLKAILGKSKDIRGRKDIKAVRTEVKEVNRHVDYEPGKGVGVHSLHAANDIAAVSNSKVHDYAQLAPKLDKRLRSNGATADKQYFKAGKTVAERHEHVGKGLDLLTQGKPDEAKAAFKEAGLTKKGRKWAYKMGTLMLAEHGREVNGRNPGQVTKALGEIKKGKTFDEVFVKKADTLAPFAKRGGAKTFK